MSLQTVHTKHSHYIILKVLPSSVRSISFKGTIFLQAIPSLRPFNPDDFLATLELYGPQLTSGIRGDWEGLYRRFFRSVNFSVWFNARYQEVSDKLSALHLQALCDAVSTGRHPLCNRSNPP